MPATSCLVILQVLVCVFALPDNEARAAGLAVNFTSLVCCVLLHLPACCCRYWMVPDFERRAAADLAL
jgi:hypothetical protein